MQKKSFLSIVLTVSVFLLLVSCATGYGCNPVDEYKKESITVSVNGTGTIGMDADMVTFQIQVSEIAKTTGEAQQLTNKKVSKILSILREYKIEDKDISTTSLNFSTQYEWDNNLQKSVKSGEQVSQTIFVKMKDLDNFGNLVDKIGSDVSGISFYSVNFEASDYSQAQIEARKLAYQDAYTKALTYANAAGLKLGNPISVSDGYTSTSTRVANDGLMKAYAMEAAATYGTEAPTGTLNVSVNVQIVFNMIAD